MTDAMLIDSGERARAVGIAPFPLILRYGKLSLVQTKRGNSMQTAFVPKPLRPDGLPMCMVADCERPIMAKSMCAMHYNRFRKHQSVDLPYANGKVTPNISRGRTELQRWSRLRKKYPDQQWVSKNHFVDDVGPNPKRYTIAPVRDDEPIGPGNWRYLTSGFDHTTPEGKKAYRQQWGIRMPYGHKRNAIKRTYGITVEEFLALEKEHNGLCAICRQPETSTREGKVRKLCIDHDHEAGTVRGLLCVSCNSLVGFSHEDVTVLEAAIRYLKQHNVNKRKKIISEESAP